MTNCPLIHTHTRMQTQEAAPALVASSQKSQPHQPSSSPAYPFVLLLQPVCLCAIILVSSDSESSTCPGIFLLDHVTLVFTSW